MRSWVPRQIATVAGVLALSTLSQSCLIAPPDPLEEPERIPPRALVHDALPVVTQIVQTTRGAENPSFNVPFVSDDLGEPVEGKLFLNYPNGRFLNGSQTTAGTLNEERDMIVQWGAGRQSLPTGCYTITMTITHKDNYTADGPPADESKTAFVTWWIAHGTDLQLVNLDECTPPQTAIQ